MTRTKVSHILVQVNTDQMEEAKFPHNDIIEFACRELNCRIEKLENEVGVECTVLNVDTDCKGVSVTKKEGLSAYDAKVKYGTLPPAEDFKLRTTCKLSAFIIFKIPETKMADNVDWDRDNGMMN